jgi:Fe2+ or Zn2+ uptake regulation protein
MVDPGGRERAMLDRLRQIGLKLTTQRLAIVRELSHDVSHPTAQELFERLSPSLPTMSFATVYNTLGALVSAGLCAPKTFGPGPVRFDPNTEPHHHAICDRCGRVTDVLPAEPHRPDGASGISGFTVRAVERIYRGVCAACRDLEDSPSA